MLSVGNSDKRFIMLESWACSIIAWVFKKNVTDEQEEMEDDMKATLAALEDTLAEHRLVETEEGKQYRQTHTHT